jgi:protein-L-isoaspartate(D-aspartate) O-methyltransferase
MSNDAAQLVEGLRPYVAEHRVLEAVGRVPRDLFVPAEERSRAWENVPLPIGSGQTISQPLVVARMCELLELHGSERVLDVGTGSGYHAALLAVLAGSVVSIERHAELARQAATNLRDAGIEGVEVIVGDGSQGHPPGAPYDAINVAAAAWRDVPPALEEQLAPGGRLVTPVARRGQRLVRVRREPDGSLTRDALEAVRFVPLV